MCSIYRELEVEPPEKLAQRHAILDIGRGSAYKVRPRLHMSRFSWLFCSTKSSSSELVPLPEYLGAYFDALCRVESKQPRCGPAHRREANDFRVRGCEMVVPGVLTRIKNRNHIAGLRIGGRHVRALVPIAVRTC